VTLVLRAHPRARRTKTMAQIELKKVADPHGRMNAGKTERWKAEHAQP
jgi:hypothetical protein